MQKANQPSQTQTPQTQQRSASPTGPEWVYANSIAQNNPNIPAGTQLAVKKLPNGDWKYVILSSRRVGIIPAADVQKTIQSVRRNENPLKTNRPYLSDLEKQSGNQSKSSTLIPSELMSKEQQAIDKQFEKIIKEPGQSHIMIEALAGSGKTTVLKHLAWKYGSPGQKWLYLVFNTKNKVEATEKFPNFVHVRTTNGFLGDVLKDRANIKRIKQTDRIVNVTKANKSQDSKKIEKIRLVLDGPEFGQFSQTLGIPSENIGTGYGSMTKTLTSLVKSIRYEFKEQVIKLAGLAKSYALDPRKDNLRSGIESILDDYDFDTDLTDIKERIEKYSGAYRTQVKSFLEDLLGYDFMDKNFRNEVMQATVWTLEKSMPHGIGQNHREGNIDYNLGEFRDFNDDLWFAASHADEITWPHYDIVLADEVQDFNEAQKIMLKKLHDAGAKIIAVGDKNQSIYRFRGADSDAFGNISNQLKDLSQDKNVVHNLSSNYRSRKAILDFANQETHVKNLLQGKKFKDGDGEVTKGKVKYNDAFTTLKNELAETNGTKQTAFIARTNDPLVHAALKLLTNNIPFIIVGKDIAQDLKKHIGKIIARFGLSDHADIRDLSDKLQEFKDSEHDHYHGQSTKKVYLQELSEVTEALSSSIAQFEQENHGRDINIFDFKKWIGQKLGGLDVEENEQDLKAYKKKLEEENPVILTTAHKSKGLEFERVYLLRYDQFPHKKATRPKDMAQEENARYVAITRAMDELHILDLESQPGYKK